MSKGEVEEEKGKRKKGKRNATASKPHVREIKKIYRKREKKKKGGEKIFDHRGPIFISKQSV